MLCIVEFECWCLFLKLQYLHKFLSIHWAVSLLPPLLVGHWITWLCPLMDNETDKQVLGSWRDVWPQLDGEPVKPLPSEKGGGAYIMWYSVIYMLFLNDFFLFISCVCVFEYVSTRLYQAAFKCFSHMNTVVIFKVAIHTSCNQHFFGGGGYIEITMSNRVPYFS